MIWTTCVGFFCAWCVFSACVFQRCVSEAECSFPGELELLSHTPTTHLISSSNFNTLVCSVRLFQLWTWWMAEPLVAFRIHFAFMCFLLSCWPNPVSPHPLSSFDCLWALSPQATLPPILPHLCDQPLLHQGPSLSNSTSVFHYYNSRCHSDNDKWQIKCNESPWEGQTRRTRQITQKKTKGAPEGGRTTLFLVLGLWKLNKQKTLQRGKHTGYEN